MSNKKFTCSRSEIYCFQIKRKENGFEWIGEYDVTADDLLSGTAKGTKSKAAIDFLEEFVLNGAETSN